MKTHTCIAVSLALFVLLGGAPDCSATPVREATDKSFTVACDERLVPADAPVADPLANRALPKVERLTTPVHAPLEFVKDGKCNFAIVARLNEESARYTVNGKLYARGLRCSVEHAAYTLYHNVVRSLGVKPLLLDESDPRVRRARFVLAVGETKWSEALGIDPQKLPREGFEIQTFSNGVVIVGHDWAKDGYYDEFCQMSTRLTCNGTELGAVDFMERFLGIRDFTARDRELWHIVPPRESLVLAPCAYRDYPRYWTRWPPNENWRYGISTDFFGGEAPDPRDFGIVHSNDLEAAFYRDEKGELQYDERNQRKCFFDVTNPKLADLLVADWKKYFAQGGKGTYWSTDFAPTTHYLWFGQCDRGVEIRNDRARALARANPYRCSVMSEVYGAFYDYMARQCARELPGRTLVVEAYAHFLLPPERIDRFPDNLQVLACQGTPVLIRNPRYREHICRFYESWNAKCAPDKKCVPYTYDMPGESLVPAFLRGYFEGEFLRAIRPHVDPHRIYTCLDRGSKPGQFWNILSSYLIFRALWNPDCDADAVMEDFFRLSYGAEAGEHLIRLYRILLDRWVNHYLPRLDRGHVMNFTMTPNQCCRSIPYLEISRFHAETLTPDVLTALGEELAAAKDALPPQDIYARRFGVLYVPFTNMLAKARTYGEILRRSDFAIGREETELPSLVRYTLSGQPGVRGTRPKAKWDEKGLSFVFHTTWMPRREDNPFTKSTQLDVMIAPGTNPSHFYCLTFAPTGTVRAARRAYADPKAPVEAVAADGIRASSNVVEPQKSWTCEAFVPWSALGARAPRPGEAWKVNFIQSGPVVWYREFHSISPTQEDIWREDLCGTATFR